MEGAQPLVTATLRFGPHCLDVSALSHPNKEKWLSCLILLRGPGVELRRPLDFWADEWRIWEQQIALFVRTTSPVDIADLEDNIRIRIVARGADPVAQVVLRLPDGLLGTVNFEVQCSGSAIESFHEGLTDLIAAFVRT